MNPPFNKASRCAKIESVFGSEDRQLNKKERILKRPELFGLFWPREKIIGGGQSNVTTISHPKEFKPKSF